MYAILLQAGSGSALPINLIMMGLMLVVMYFFFIRPQAQKQKKQISFENELKKGDTVVTSSGIIGTITKIGEKDITMQISQKGFVDVVKSAVSREMTENYNKKD